MLSIPCMQLRVATKSPQCRSTADEADLYLCDGQALPPRYGNQHHASTGAAQSSGLHGAQPGGAATLPHASSGSLSAPSAQSAPQLPQVGHCPFSPYRTHWPAIWWLFCQKIWAWGRWTPSLVFQARLVPDVQVLMQCMMCTVRQLHQ